MNSLNLLARLAGAQPDVLSKARTDRVKYTAMGGVLLTTAGVAGVSAAFALNSSLDLPIAPAAVAGLLWAVVIFNLDRMLIISIKRQSGPLRNLLSAVPRLLLAIVIGTVVSIPLVLRIFQPEINGEMQVMHSENLIAAQKKLDEQFADIEPTQKKVDELQSVASGQSQPNVSGDPDVAAAQQRAKDAQAAYDQADQAAQCELVGSCGTHQPGVGEAYRQAKAKADQAKATLDDEKGKLDTAIQAAKAKISGSVASNRDAAKRELDTLRPQLEKRQADRAEAQGRLDRGEINNEGLLARLEALDRLSSGHALMKTAHWALILLFLLIEVLPVVVKLLSIIGPPTLYDRILDSTETTLEKRASKHDDVVLAIEDDLRDEQIRQGKETNKLLVAKQSAIATKAIDTWAKVAMSRTDDELARWYAAHLGQPAPAAAPPAPASGMPAAVTIPLMTPVPAPAAAPQRVTGGSQTYQQFKALAGTPTNGHHPGGPAVSP